MPQQQLEIATSLNGQATLIATRITSEDPYSFFSIFDTVLLVDNSGSIAGPLQREVSQALATIAPIIIKYNSDNINIYFLNYKSKDASKLFKGVIAIRYKGIKRAITITNIFKRVKL